MEFRRKKLLEYGYGNPAFPTPAFYAPLNDLGSGAVNTALSIGTGSATFTRATVAWAKLSSGLWAQVASGTARSHYSGANTAVGSYLGYFSEAAGTQLVTPSAAIRDMSDASWVKVNMTAAKTATGIDGAVNSATLLTSTGANATILQTLAAAASTRTYSLFIENVDAGSIELTQDGGATWSTPFVTAAGTYYRQTITASVLNASFGIRIAGSGESIKVDFNQFEAGSVATSPMDAAGAVRNEDLLTYPSSGNISNTVGVAYAEICPFQVKSTGALKGIICGATGVSAPLYLDSGTALLSLFDGTEREFGDPGLPLSASKKVATIWRGATCDGYIAGTVGTTRVFDGNMNMGVTLGIGNLAGGAGALTGTVKEAKIWVIPFNTVDMTRLTR